MYSYKQPPLKPWIEEAILNCRNSQQHCGAVLARIVELNWNEDTSLQDSGRKTQKQGTEGTIADSQVFIKAVFSNAAFDCREDWSDSQLSSLAGTHIILKKYTLGVSQLERERRCEFIVYVEKFRDWGQGGHFSKDVRNCNELPHIRRALGEIYSAMCRNQALCQDSESKAASSESENSMTQVSLTQLIEVAGIQFSQEQEEDDIVEVDNTVLLIPSDQEAQLAGMCVQSVEHGSANRSLSTEEQKAQRADVVEVDITHLMIPEDQKNQLADMEVWKPDYIPPCSQKWNSSYLEQAMCRDLPLPGTYHPDFYLERDLSPVHSLDEPDSYMYLTNPLDHQRSLRLSMGSSTDAPKEENEECKNADSSEVTINEPSPDIVYMEITDNLTNSVRGTEVLKGNQSSLDDIMYVDDYEHEHEQTNRGVYNECQSQTSRKRKLESSQQGLPSGKTKSTVIVPSTSSQDAEKTLISKASMKKGPILLESPHLPHTLPTPQYSLESFQPCQVYKAQLSSSSKLPEGDSAYPSQQALREAILKLKYPRRQLTALINMYVEHSQPGKSG